MGAFLLVDIVHSILKFIVLTELKSSPSEVFLRKCVLKICQKFTGEHPCRSTISINLLCNFMEITIRHGCFPVNLLHIFRTPFPKNTSGRLPLRVNVFMHKLGFRLYCIQCEKTFPNLTDKTLQKMLMFFSFVFLLTLSMCIPIR